MVNVSLHASFNEVVDVDLFVRNLLNEDAFSNGGNRIGAQFGGFQLRPRTIGVRLSYNL